MNTRDENEIAFSIPQQATLTQPIAGESPRQRAICAICSGVNRSALAVPARKPAKRRWR